jgi:dUTPase
MVTTLDARRVRLGKGQELDHVLRTGLATNIPELIDGACGDESGFPLNQGILTGRRR